MILQKFKGQKKKNGRAVFQRVRDEIGERIKRFAETGE
jgi:hypothetical protein